jgi:hypothetical protein
MAKPVSNKAELKEVRDMLVVIRDNVAKLKRAGRGCRGQAHRSL